MDDVRHVQTAQSQLLVALAQAVLTLHQIGSVPQFLRIQLQHRVADLEALTMAYARALPATDGDDRVVPLRPGEKNAGRSGASS